MAVYSQADRDALHAQLADEAVCIGKAASADSYLNMERILSSTVATRAEAIHPGFGFLSENSRFAQMCEKCRVTFIGPGAELIARMGNKSEAKNTMGKAGVPVIPGTREPVYVAEEARRAAKKIGYPVMIKASSGGYFPDQGIHQDPLCDRWGIFPAMVYSSGEQQSSGLSRISGENPGTAVKNRDGRGCSGGRGLHRRPPCGDGRDGFPLFEGQPVTVLGIQKGRSTRENIRRNFAMPSPEGYRKALRLMKQAEKFHRPVIAFIDTPEAFSGLEAEERGQGEAIARNLMEMAELRIPVLSIVIGEGGSGGALALGVANEVWMMENAAYTILSPEGFASILWKDSRRAPEAAEAMKATAAHLKELGIIDRVIPESVPLRAEHMEDISECLKIRIKEFLRAQAGKTGEQLAGERYERFRRM